MDYGLDMLACYWIAVDTFGRAYIYRELYEPNLIISEAARRINMLSPHDEHVEQTMAPPDMWNRRQDTGKSVAELFADQGIYLTKTSNDRVQGWYNLKEWLRPTIDETGARCAGLRIFAIAKSLSAVCRCCNTMTITPTTAQKTPMRSPMARTQYATLCLAAHYLQHHHQPRRGRTAG